MANKDDFKPRPRVPKGARPFALGDRHLERVLSMLVAVAAEVSVVYDRYDTLARILAEKGMVKLEDLESFVPDDEVEAQREAWRQAFLRAHAAHSPGGPAGRFAGGARRELPQAAGEAGQPPRMTF